MRAPFAFTGVVTRNAKHRFASEKTLVKLIIKYRVYSL